MKGFSRRQFTVSVSTLLLASSVLAVVALLALRATATVALTPSAKGVLDILGAFLFAWIPLGLALGSIASVVYISVRRSLQHVIELAGGILSLLALHLLRFGQ